MPLVSADLDTIQLFLRDSGTTWDRTELLRWYQDGYRKLLAESHGVRQLTILPVPPRHSYSYAYGWEKRHLQGGTGRLFGYQGPTGGNLCTALWEIEQAAGMAPTTQQACVTHLWELAYTGEAIDTPYRFTLPRNHERILGMWYDHKPLEPISTRELDRLETAWYQQQGEPVWTTPGGGEPRSVELYEIVTTYQDVYSFVDWAFYGFPRYLEGARDYAASGIPLENGYAYTTQGDALANQQDIHFALLGFGLRCTQELTATYQGTYVWERERHAGATSLSASGTIGTYSWEADYGATNMGDYPPGLMREISSPDRQYLPIADWEPPYGTIRDFRSSAGNVLLWEVVIPDHPTLEETDTPVMIPAPLQKYLRYYTLSCAFNRQGEGYRPDLAAHWKARWERGPHLLRKLGNLHFADVRYQRQTGREVPRPQRVSPYAPLPSDYQRVRVP